jgi:DNA modification methylase
VKDILADDGVLWLNIGDSYCGTASKGDLVDPKYPNGRNGQSVSKAQKLVGYKSKDLIGIPWMLAFALRADGWYLRQDIIWHKPNPMPESVQDRCTKAHEYIFLLSKSQKYFYDNEAIKVPVKEDWGTRDRTDGKYHNEGTGLQPHTGLEKSYEMANKRSVWTVNTKPYKGAHFAVFPQELIEPCILAGSRIGDVVLDPFMGSGTTAQVAQQLGRKYLGCELNPDYKALQDKRVAQQALELL